MSPRVSEIKFRGQVENRDGAFKLLSHPGDVAIVVRDKPRLMVMKCPCGCGDDLVINLDPRSGKAWRFYRNKQLSLYPSYWRDSACGCHFILLRDHIYWCFDSETEESEEWEISSNIEELVFNTLSKEHYLPYEFIAQELNLIPWEALQACRQLMKRGKVRKKWLKGEYRRIAANESDY